jgi:hypothetical protein
MPYLVKRFGNILTFNSAVALSALSMIPLALIPHWSIAGFVFYVYYGTGGHSAAGFYRFPTGIDSTALAHNHGRGRSYNIWIRLCHHSLWRRIYH